MAVLLTINCQMGNTFIEKGNLQHFLYIVPDIVVIASTIVGQGS